MLVFPLFLIALFFVLFGLLKLINRPTPRLIEPHCASWGKTIELKGIPLIRFDRETQ